MNLLKKNKLKKLKSTNLDDVIVKEKKIKVIRREFQYFFCEKFDIKFDYDIQNLFFKVPIESHLYLQEILHKLAYFLIAGGGKLDVYFMFINFVSKK